MLHTDIADEQSVPTEEHARVVLGTVPLYMAVEGMARVVTPGEETNAKLSIVKVEAPQWKFTLDNEPHCWKAYAPMEVTLAGREIVVSPD